MPFVHVRAADARHNIVNDQTHTTTQTAVILRVRVCEYVRECPPCIALIVNTNACNAATNGTDGFVDSHHKYHDRARDGSIQLHAHVKCVRSRIRRRRSLRS